MEKNCRIWSKKFAMLSFNLYICSRTNEIDRMQAKALPHDCRQTAYNDIYKILSVLSDDTVARPGAVSLFCMPGTRSYKIMRSDFAEKVRPHILFRKPSLRKFNYITIVLTASAPDLTM